jgi:hypothetical protein
VEQGDQQEQDAREENRAAGKYDTEEGEHRAAIRNMARQRVRAARAYRTIGPARAGASGPVPAGVSRMSMSILAPLLRAGSRQNCTGNVPVPWLQDSRLTMTRLEQMSSVPGRRKSQGRARDRLAVAVDEVADTSAGDVDALVARPWRSGRC